MNFYLKQKLNWSNQLTELLLGDSLPFGGIKKHTWESEKKIKTWRNFFEGQSHIYLTTMTRDLSRKHDNPRKLKTKNFDLRIMKRPIL